MKARRQIGAKHVAWMRGAFPAGGPGPARPGPIRQRDPSASLEGSPSRPTQGVGQPANPETDGATRGAGALTGGLHHIGTDDFRDLSGEAAAAGLNIAQFA